MDAQIGLRKPVIHVIDPLINFHGSISDGFSGDPPFQPLVEPWLFLGAVGLCVFAFFLLHHSAKIEEWSRPAGKNVPQSDVGLPAAYAVAGFIALAGATFVHFENAKETLMSNCIAIAIGHNRDSTTECNRTASRAAEVKANTRTTFITAYLSADGSGHVTVERLKVPDGTPTILARLRFNSEASSQPEIIATGLLGIALSKPGADTPDLFGNE